MKYATDFHNFLARSGKNELTTSNRLFRMKTNSVQNLHIQQPVDFQITCLLTYIRLYIVWIEIYR